MDFMHSVSNIAIDKTLLILAGVLISTLHLDLFYYAYDTPKWFAFDILLGLFIFLNHSHIKSIGLSPFSIIVFISLIYTCLMSFVAPHVGMALEFSYRYLLVISSIYILSTKYSSKELLSIISTSVFFSSLAFILLFYIERYWVETPSNVGSFSPFGFINNTGQVFNIWIPILVLICLRLFNKPKYLFATFPILIAIVSILMEASVRSCIIGLFLGEALVFSIMLFKDAKKAILFLSTSILLLIGIGSYQLFDALESGRLSNKISEMENSISASKSRLDIFSNTLDMVLENPLGIGTNNFEYIHPLYAKIGTNTASPFVDENQILRTPHNIVLKIYSEQGYIGGTLFFLLLSSLFIFSIHNGIKGSFTDRWLLVACTALLFHSMLSAVFLTPGSLFFSILLFSMIICRYRELRPTQAIVTLELRATWFPSIAISIISTLFITSSYYSYRGFQRYSIEDLQIATSLNPYNDRALYTLSFLEYRKHYDVEASYLAIEEFLSLYPYHIAANQIKSERLFQLKKFNEALSNTEFLLNYYPSYGKALRLRSTIQANLQ